MQAEELRVKIREVMDFVHDSVTRGIEPNFRVLETTHMSDFFDTERHCLVLNYGPDNYREIKLIAHSFTFHKILVLLDFLD